MANDIFAQALALKAISSGGGSEPSEYLKNAVVTNNTLTITKKNGSAVEFTPEGSSYTAGRLIDITDNVISFNGEIPTKTSDLTNDSGFLTQHQSLSAYRTSTAQDVIDATKQPKLTAGSNITIDENNVISAGGGEPDAYIKSASVNENTLTLTDKEDNEIEFSVDVPTNVSELTNDAGYITQDNIPTNVSAFTNDVGYLTQHQSLAAYRTSAAQDIIDEGKQDVVSDLQAIRAGAALGATALQEVPSEYVTQTELEAYHDVSKQDVLTAGNNISITNNVISATDTTYLDATTSASGLMSASDKTKLNGISSGATAVSVSATGTATDEVGYITIDGVEKKLAGGGGGEPAAYIKNASVSNKTLTLTKKDDSTITFTDTGSVVSGTNDGTNWSTITIDGVSKNIPTSSGGGVSTIKNGTGDYSELFNFGGYNIATTHIASGDYSHAEGVYNQATGKASHVEGYKNEATGEASHAEGEWSKAIGEASHAEGFSTQATGHQSHAEGSGTIAAGNEQHAQGRYNIEDSSGTYAFIIGNGVQDSNRSNALTVDWQGNLVCKNIPAPPTSNGSYQLTCTITSGVVSYS